MLVSSSCKEFVQGLRTSTLVPTVWQTFWLYRLLLIKSALALCVVLSLGEALGVAQTVLLFMARCGGSVLTIRSVTKRISSRRSPKQNLAPSLTAVTRVQIPSGTPNLFRSRRTVTFGAGTKRHNSVANSARRHAPTHLTRWFPRSSRDLLGHPLESPCPGLAQSPDILDRRLAEETAIFATELRWTFVADLESGARRIHTAVQHQVSR